MKKRNWAIVDTICPWSLEYGTDQEGTLLDFSGHPDVIHFTMYKQQLIHVEMFYTNVLCPEPLSVIAPLESLQGSGRDNYHLHSMHLFYYLFLLLLASQHLVPNRLLQ